MSASIGKLLRNFKVGDAVCRKSDNAVIKFMKISEINIYPIKSLAGISLKSSVVEERGLKFDRRRMLVDSSGRFISQRECPKMAALATEIGDRGLKIKSPESGEIFVPFDVEGDSVSTTVWDSACRSIPYSREINDWFSSALSVNCRLVLMPDDQRRGINPAFRQNDEIVSFADGYPLLLIGEASLNALNKRLEFPVPMNRFRPNLVVSGAEEFAEDLWSTVSIGETVCRVVKPCARCVITTIDQGTGEVTGKEPLKALASFRMAKAVYPENFQDLGLTETGVLFGQNLVPINFGETIKIGDSVTPIKTK